MAMICLIKFVEFLDLFQLLNEKILTNLTDLKHKYLIYSNIKLYK